MRRALLFIEEFPQKCFEETGSRLYQYKKIVLGWDLTQINNYATDPNVIVTECPEKMQSDADAKMVDLPAEGAVTEVNLDEAPKKVNIAVPAPSLVP